MRVTSVCFVSFYSREARIHLKSERLTRHFTESGRSHTHPLFFFFPCQRQPLSYFCYRVLILLFLECHINELHAVFFVFWFLYFQLNIFEIHLCFPSIPFVKSLRYSCYLFFISYYKSAQKHSMKILLKADSLRIKQTWCVIPAWPFSSFEILSILTQALSN